MLTKSNNECQECKDDAKRLGYDLAWYCWMFGCADCAENHRYCKS